MTVKPVKQRQRRWMRTVKQIGWGVALTSLVGGGGRGEAVKHERLT